MDDKLYIACYCNESQMKKDHDELRPSPSSKTPAWTLRVLCLALFIRASDLSKEEPQKYEGLAAIVAPIIVGALVIAGFIVVARLLG